MIPRVVFGHVKDLQYSPGFRHLGYRQGWWWVVPGYDPEGPFKNAACAARHYMQEYNYYKYNKKIFRNTYNVWSKDKNIKKPTMKQIKNWSKMK